MFFFSNTFARLSLNNGRHFAVQAVRAHSRRSAHRKGEGGAHRWVRQRMCASY